MLYHLLPAFLNVWWSEPPHIAEVLGRTGDVVFRWELAAMSHTIETTTQEDQTRAFGNAILREVLANTR